MDYYLLTELFLPSTGLMSTSQNHWTLVLYGKELLDEESKTMLLSVRNFRLPGPFSPSRFPLFVQKVLENILNAPSI